MTPYLLDTLLTAQNVNGYSKEDLSKRPPQDGNDLDFNNLPAAINGFARVQCVGVPAITAGDRDAILTQQIYELGQHYIKL